MKKIFKLEENHTTPGIEVRVGLTTFFAMAYIIFLNPVFLSGTGMDPDGVLAATCVSAVIGTLLCALCGTSTVTSYAESAAGIAAGGRTGLTAVTTAACFLLAAFFAPLAGVVTSAATAPALIIVGVYLMMEIKKVRFEELDDAIPAFLTILVMPFAYSITTGIAVGFLSYVVCKAAAGKRKELNMPVLVLAAVFLLYFCA